MGLIIIGVILTIGVIALWIFTDLVSEIAGIGAWIIGVITGLAIIVAVVTCVEVDGNVAANHKRYESLVYQLENNLYDNDNDIGKKELYDQIDEWNTDLARGKAMYDNIWVGIYYPKALYEEFDFIEFGTMG